MKRLADYLIEFLSRNGINHIFTITGRGTLFLNDAIAASKTVASISMHNEQAASYAAVAYANTNENIAACLVSTGCGSTNAITGVLNAWQDNIPCIFISGQNKLKETSRYSGIPIRTYGQQEADIVEIINSITKYSVMITNPSHIRHELEKAKYLALSGRKGPVWIDIPLDIQNSRVDDNLLKSFSLKPKVINSVLANNVEKVENLILKSKRPSILIGSGVRSASAIIEFKSFINKTRIPVTFSNSAVDIYNTKNNFSIGSVGVMGCSRAGNFTVQNCDLLIVMGCRLSSLTSGPDPAKFAREAKIVIIDIDPIEHSKNNVSFDHLIISHLKDFLDSLNQKNIKKTEKNWLDKCLHWKKIFQNTEKQFSNEDKVDLYQLSKAFTKVLPKKATFITDSGLVELILPTNIQFNSSQRCIHPSSQGSMGYALPAIIGSYYANQNDPIISVIGDGSIMMNLQELETLKFHNIPAKIFIINNNVYAVIRKRQKELFRKRSIGTDKSNGVSCPDFKKIAKAFDINYAFIHDNNNLYEELTSVLNMEGLVICEILCPEDQDYIQIAYAKNSKGKLIVRPIEDQAPFLDRDLFLSEMVIRPIDQ